MELKPFGKVATIKHPTRLFSLYRDDPAITPHYFYGKVGPHNTAALPKVFNSIFLQNLLDEKNVYCTNFEMKIS